MLSKRMKSLSLSGLIIVHITIILFASMPALIVEATTLEQYQEAAEARKLLPIESNLIENWPQGPQIGAASAILLEANTGVILYEKNIHEKQFPASTTKMMTAVLAVDYANLNDTIPFSSTAVNSISWDSSKIGIKAGQSITFEQALYATMVHSANDVTNGIAEYVGGDLETFAEMMTNKAKELGCQNTNFTNSHGLFDEEHYTTAYDLALIAAAYFRHEMLAKIGNTVSYYIPPSDTQPEEIYLRNKHKLINGEIAVEDYNILGGKTGFVSMSRQTLITAAEKDGMRLICVILKQESPNQFEDTKQLFEYGFSNFQIVNVANNEKRYTIDNASFFQTGNDIFGDSSPLISLNPEDYLVMPKTTDFRSLVADITYHTDRPSAIAEIIYTYNNAYLGTATIDFATENRSTYDFDHEMLVDLPEVVIEEENVVFINIKQLIFIIIIFAALAILFFIIRAAVKSFHFNRRRKRRRKKPIRKSRRSRFKGYYL